ncbi:THAP domain-containing protein 5-like [Nematolebias whitei]|uniref:THAP domain-containing protein 5-like n=1 Tax=Nematolebias whitei TaxID=451745 RepID=UPI0018972F49|nr:THAP domain-containing protein 5-like [Nematolebias whitei]
MPRYCAVKICSNRGGTASRKNNKRISFYPFPLHDKSRLQKWVDNMKRQDWIPSRHQYLCSEHFTEDCFDIRWGIRYLKNTAIPTVFPLINDDGEKKVTNSKRSPKSKPCTSETDAELRQSESPSSKRPHILRKTCKQIEVNIDKNVVSEQLEQTFEPPVVPTSGKPFQSSPLQTPTTICDVTGDGGRPTASSHPEEQAGSIVAVLCYKTLGPLSSREANVDPVLQAALGQTFHSVPLEKVEEKSARCFVEETEHGEEVHVSFYEHSYSRPDLDEDELWNRILGLHAKTLELDRREKNTLAKICALENEVALLKMDEAIFKEKQKFLEDYISSVLVSWGYLNA